MICNNFYQRKILQNFAVKSNKSYFSTPSLTGIVICIVYKKHRTVD